MGKPLQTDGVVETVDLVGSGDGSMPLLARKARAISRVALTFHAQTKAVLEQLRGEANAERAARPAGVVRTVAAITTTAAETPVVEVEAGSVFGNAAVA
jgi:hypothetical protein